MIAATILALTVAGQHALPGSHLESQHAYAEARAVVVAEVAGFETVVGLGAHWYASGLELKPSAVLKGAEGDVVLKRLGMQGSGPEEFTRPGEEYIFFLGESKGNPRVLKVLPKTEEDLAALRAMGD